MKFDEVQSGQRRDPAAILLRMLLLPMSWVYGVIIKKRNRDYHSRRKPIRRVSVPVVCIGNLTTGGTGKTPIVCHLARWLRNHGVRVSIISRGYRRDESGFNDEAKELADRLPDVPHVQNPERFEAAEVAIDELATEMILMDDGFQHRRLHRDLDFVVIDATRPFGYDHLLPRGLLREPVSELRRADAVIITRCDSVLSEETNKIVDRIKIFTPSNTPIVQSCHRPSKLLLYPNNPQPLESIFGKTVVCLSAIGNPSAFEQTVRSLGVKVIGHYRLPDHADFDREAVRKIEGWMKEQEVAIDAIICTHKDLVKIQADRIAGFPVMAMQIDLHWIDDPVLLYEQLDALLPDS